MPLLRYFLVVGSALTLSLYLLASMLDPGPSTAAQALVIPVPRERPVGVEAKAVAPEPKEPVLRPSANLAAVIQPDPAAPAETKKVDPKPQRAKRRVPHSRETVERRGRQQQVYVIRRGGFEVYGRAGHQPYFSPYW
jgi:hypothetical protein